ncbi:MAG: DUF2436 domain-containing protein [Bacteroidetes bacterium]|nr:DUF2436 domain-containing protein [Bacteroidota bacterium]MCL2303316.1 DUF2436 domain-containing protein [Lentimicrobiaceae bacterium]
MKKLFFIVVVSTLLILGLHAQNSTSRLAPVGVHEKAISNNKSERYSLIKKDGKVTGLFDNVSQQKVSLTGATSVPDKSVVKTKLGFVTKKSGKQDVATITLNVIGDPWGNGTGFQMCLYADGVLPEGFDIYDWIFEPELFYSNSEYKIPENASADLNNPQVILDGTGSVDIPGGVYDFIFLRPTPQDDFIWLCNWAGTDDLAAGYGYPFVAGFEYIFTIEQQSYVVFEAPNDIKMSKIILPQPSLDLTDQEEISLVLYNNGIENITGEVELSYVVNDEDYIIIETYFISELAPGEEITYTFDAKVNFSAIGFYTVTAHVEYEFDSNPYNNTLTGLTKKFEVIEVPFFDDFATPSSMLRWSTIDGNGDGYSWQYDNWLITDADGGYGCLQVLCQTYGADEYLVTDPIAMNAGVAYGLSFYSYRLGNDNLKVLYGTTYNVEEMELLKVVIPDPSDWTQNMILFDVETDGNYFFAFHYEGVYSNGSRGVNFDNFMIERFGNIPEIVPNEYQLKLYPNPVSGVLHVELKDATINKVEVYNSLGQIVNTTSGVNDSMFKLNTTSFPTGLYFISVQTKVGIVNKRFIVE